MLSARVLLRFLPVRFSSPQRHAQLRTRGIQRPAGPVRAPKGAAPARPIGRPGRPPPVGACVRLLGQCMKLCMTLCPPPPPPSRTDWTRLVPPSVLTGHVSFLLAGPPGGHLAREALATQGPQRGAAQGPCGQGRGGRRGRGAHRRQGRPALRGGREAAAGAQGRERGVEPEPPGAPGACPCVQLVRQEGRDVSG